MHELGILSGINQFFHDRGFGTTHQWGTLLEFGTPLKFCVVLAIVNAMYSWHVFFFFGLQPLRSVRFKRRSLGQKLGSLDSEMAGRFWSWITPCFGPKV
jgi:hypothetical protein